MSHALHAFWTPLSLTPLLWLNLTLVAYLVGRGVQKLSHGSPFANPVLIAIVIVAHVVRVWIVRENLTAVMRIWFACSSTLVSMKRFLHRISWEPSQVKQEFLEMSWDRFKLKTSTLT
mgnify:CR=1 FL=1